MTQWALGASTVVINEIHASPVPKTDRVEFVELYNRGPEAVNLTGWAFTEGIEFGFPAGTQMGPGGYLVVAESPSAVRARYGVEALGPWTGRLAGEGERLRLEDASGEVMDEVTYGLGFPWPTVGEAPGYSMELVHPAADNDLGGHWRASVAGETTSTPRQVLAEGGEWRYRKGPESAPVGWRELEYGEAGWAVGPAPIGYDPNLRMGTMLDDMRGGYMGFFLRRNFELTGAAQVTQGVFEVLYDDGFKLWVNGQPLMDVGMPAGEVGAGQRANPVRENDAYEKHEVAIPAGMLREGRNVIAVQVANANLADSSDAFFDARLSVVVGPSGRGPTPGRLNVAYRAELPPALRQVAHEPQQPGSGESVKVTVKVTSASGLAGVRFEYQVVEPGAYVELTEDAYATRWESLAMNDAGVGGDAVAGDDRYTVIVPGALQVHRRLVRYRITATDRAGGTVRAPYADDPQPNFAWFCYDGVPAWTGAVRPGSTAAFTVEASEMNRLPVYHLVAKRKAVEDCTWFDRSHGDEYFWRGTLVYDGEVYDHIRFRPRGGVWRYAMGKNMWKFDFHRGHDFKARDDWGRRFGTGWTKLNLGASIQQGDYLHRGEQGMFESVGFRLFQLVGQPAMHTAFVQFRIIDEVEEQTVGDQYRGDFWGLYLVTEQPDGRFLEEHGLADGNFYKMEGGWGDPNNLGPAGPTDYSDLRDFMNAYPQTQPEAWWRTHLNLPAYYGYQAIVQAIHHYDIADGKNYFYHRDPETGVWTVVPWDLDLTWADNMYRGGQQGGDEPFKSRLLSNFASSATYPAVTREFRNRVREIRDLLWNEDEAFRLIDEYARRLRGTAERSLIDADRAQWDYHPVMVNGSVVDLSKAGHGRFYQQGVGTKDFAGMVQLMKNYVRYRASDSNFSLDTIAREPERPARPTVTATGPADFPVNALRFAVSPFQGSAFGRLQWRLAEISRPADPGHDTGSPQHYEITPVWESGDRTSPELAYAFPPGVARVAHVYRVRARYLDVEGRASPWSAPVEFVAGAPETGPPLLASLRLSELMYDPVGGSAFEFVELKNLSAEAALDLGGATFTEGISFTFPAGAKLGPGAYLLIVAADPADGFAAFRARYGLTPEVAITGPYAGSLRNEGETVTLKTAMAGAVVFSWEYGDGPGWPVAADGAGHSLVPRVIAGEGQRTGALDYAGNWRASTFRGGSPAREDPEPATGPQLNEIAANTPAEGPLGANDWIELGNRAVNPVILGPGWYLSDDAENLQKWAVPETTIPAGGWVVFDERTGFGATPGQGFGLDREGDSVYLSYLPGTGQDRVVDAVRFGAQAEGYSLGRHPLRPDWWTTLEPPSRGEANTAPPVRPWLAEVMYHPPDREEGGVSVDDGASEYLEIAGAGRTGEVLALTLAGPWRVTGDVEFTFPSDFILAGLERAVLVSFAPADAAATAQFWNRYGGAGSGVQLVGPYAGRLDNRRGRVSLQKPLAPSQPGEPPVWETVDELRFADQEPWPTAPDGLGLSLHRRSALLPAADPGSWTAAVPSPGTDAMVTDRDGDGMPDAWELTNGLDPARAADAREDADGDGVSNLEEYRAGTDPQVAEVTLRLEILAVGESGQLTLRFRALAGVGYRLEATTALGRGAWETREVIPAGPDSRSVVLTVPAFGGTTQAYYRITH